jgi:outer membrane protein assembly factor BamB
LECINGTKDSHGMENDERAHAIGVSADGTQVYVGGDIGRGTGDFDYATVAFNATTGAHLWTARTDGTGTQRGDDQLTGLTVTPTFVAVTDLSPALPPGQDYATVAYTRQ